MTSWNVILKFNNFIMTEFVGWVFHFLMLATIDTWLELRKNVMHCRRNLMHVKKLSFEKYGGDVPSFLYDCNEKHTPVDADAEDDDEEYDSDYYVDITQD